VELPTPIWLEKEQIERPIKQINPLLGSQKDLMLRIPSGEMKGNGGNQQRESRDLLISIQLVQIMVKRT
jgi:hypothetical protein